MCRPEFTPETIGRTPRHKSGVIAAGSWKGENYRVNVYDSLSDFVEIDGTAWEPQYAVALQGEPHSYLEGWWKTKAEREQVQVVRSVIRECGLECATRVVRDLWDEQAVGFTIADSPWGEVCGVSFGANDEDEHRMQARDLMEFLNGDWADVALEVQREDDWVRLKASDMPNSEFNDGEDLWHLLESFEQEVTGECSPEGFRLTDAHLVAA